ncbi:MAG: hypothetical protein F9K29_15260 [Hyphomicrobiaceae bacterium]|nr:MAG: hypothetical protein F9K29_15260 [Hyphomicrobiaceae bacterium]
MMHSASSFAHWHFQVPNLIFIAMIYLLLLRLLLLPALAPDNIVMRLVRAATAPVFKPVAFLTPRAVPNAIVILLVIAWLLVLRILLAFGATAAGVRPALS